MHVDRYIDFQDFSKEIQAQKKTIAENDKIIKSLEDPDEFLESMDRIRNRVRYYYEPRMVGCIIY